MRPLLPLHERVTVIAIMPLFNRRNTAADEGYERFIEKTFINWKRGDYTELS